MRAGGIKLLAHRRGRASLAVAVRPPLIQKEVTLETVTPHFEILETGEIDETVFSKGNVKKRPGTKCVLRGGPVKSPETSEAKSKKWRKPWTYHTQRVTPGAEHLQLQARNDRIERVGATALRPDALAATAYG